MNSPKPISSLVSVIIIYTDQTEPLLSTVKSIAQQSYHKHEILLLNISIACRDFDFTEPALLLRKFRRPGMSVPAARNFAIDQSHGDHLLFLEPGELLYNDALFTSSQILEGNRQLAFASGGSITFSEPGPELDCSINLVLSNHYSHFLLGNYVGTHGSVMYQRWIFNHFRFDSEIDHISEYDLFLKVARNFPVVHHSNYMAISRRKETESINEILKTLELIQNILKKQKLVVRDKNELRCLRNGMQISKNLYSEMAYKYFLRKNQNSGMLDYKSLWLLFSYKPLTVCKILYANLFSIKVSQPENIGKKQLQFG